MVFKPGNDPNRFTGGTKKRDLEFIEELKKRTPRSLEILDNKLKSNDWEAARWCLEMQHGKPKQAAEISGSMDLTVTIIGPRKGLLSGA